MKVNKYLLLFLGLFISLNAVLFAVFQKYYLLLLHQTIIYCQEMVRTLSFHLPFNTGLLVFSFLSLIIVVACLKFLITLIKIFSLKKNLTKNLQKNSISTNLLQKTHLVGKVFIIQSDKPFAYSLGFWQPKIYISSTLVNLLSVEEIEVVLLHEKYHLDNQDPLTHTLATVAESLLPFFPLMKDFILRYRIYRELAADEAANIVAKGNIHLTSVLSKLLRFELEPAFTTVSALADADTLETRINRLKNKQYTIPRISFKNTVISIFSITMLLVLALTPVYAHEFHSENYDMVMVCSEGQSCEKVCEI